MPCGNHPHPHHKHKLVPGPPPPRCLLGLPLSPYSCSLIFIFIKSGEWETESSGIREGRLVLAVRSECGSAHKIYMVSHWSHRKPNHDHRCGSIHSLFFFFLFFLFCLSVRSSFLSVFFMCFWFRPMFIGEISFDNLFGVCCSMHHPPSSAAGACVCGWMAKIFMTFSVWYFWYFYLLNENPIFLLDNIFRLHIGLDWSESPLPESKCWKFFMDFHSKAIIFVWLSIFFRI